MLDILLLPRYYSLFLTTRGRMMSDCELRVNNKKIRGLGVYDSDLPKRYTNEFGKIVKYDYYQIWYSVLTRALCEKYKEKRPCYRDAKVSEEWLNFSSFYDWFSRQPYRKGLQLDKDIISIGNQTYSKDFCLFLPREINCFLEKSMFCEDKYLKGTSFHKKTGKISSSCKRGDGTSEHLGLYENTQDAHEAWRSRKEQHANRYARFLLDHYGHLPQYVLASDSLKNLFKPENWYS